MMAHRSLPRFGVTHEALTRPERLSLTPSIGEVALVKRSQLCAALFALPNSLFPFNPVIARAVSI
jgi:hypothetical protein